jgi:hypothetical protein
MNGSAVAVAVAEDAAILLRWCYPLLTLRDADDRGYDTNCPVADPRRYIRLPSRLVLEDPVAIASICHRIIRSRQNEAEQ